MSWFTDFFGKKEREIIMAHLEALRAEVTANTLLTESIIQLVHGLAVKIEHHMGDEAALAEVVAEIRQQSSDMAAAIEENTEPDPPPVDA